MIINSNDSLQITLQELDEKKHISMGIKLINKYFKITDICFHNLYNKQLNSKEFTIISNNCWGGIIYEHFGLQKQSPTIGAYFFANDYLKFISNFNYYIKKNLEIIPPSQSKYYKILKIKNQLNVPIGRLDNDIEIIFLHYHSSDEVKEKWNKRVKRISDKIIFKFSEQNLCTYDNLKEFNNLPLRNKILFTKQRYNDINSIVLPFYKNKISLLSDIHEYRFAMKKIMKIINSL